MPLFLGFEQALRLILYEEHPDFLIGGFPGLLPGPEHVDDGLHPRLRQHRQKHRVHDLLLLARQIAEGYALEQAQDGLHGEGPGSCCLRCFFSYSKISYARIEQAIDSCYDWKLIKILKTPHIHPISTIFRAPPISPIYGKVSCSQWAPVGECGSG